MPGTAAIIRRGFDQTFRVAARTHEKAKTLAFESTLSSEERSLSRELVHLRRDVGRQSHQLDQVIALLIKLASDHAAPAAQASAAPRHFIAKPVLDPATVRRVIRQRKNRQKYFPADLFADPAWDMLLDLAAAKVERKRVSITSLCLASGVPMTTALRWLSVLTDKNLIERKEDPADGRRVFVELSEDAFMAMARYFSSVEENDALPA